MTPHRRPTMNTKDQRTLETFERYVVEHKESPTVRELAKELGKEFGMEGDMSPSAALWRMNRLLKFGLLTRRERRGGRCYQRAA